MLIRSISIAAVLASVVLLTPVAGAGTANPAESWSAAPRNAAEHPLQVPDCASPRETLESFFTITRAIKDVFLSGDYPGDIDARQESELIRLYGQLGFLFDLSEIPSDVRFTGAHVVESELSEILDKIPLPPLDAVPDVAMVQEQKLSHWRIPGTEIVLTRVPDGLRSGDWIFSRETVHRMKEFRQRTDPLPYRTDANVGEISRIGGILAHYLSYTGAHISPALTAKLPDWSRVRVGGDPLWKWIASALLIAIVAVISLFLFRMQGTIQPGDCATPRAAIAIRLRRMILPLALLILLPFTIQVITYEIRLRFLPLVLADAGLWISFYLVAVWIVIALAGLISDVLIASPVFRADTFDASLIRFVSRLIAYVTAFWILFSGVDRLGLSLVPLVASLGVGGLAFALAARPTLGNIIAGIVLHADKPFAIGDRVAVGSYEGTIEGVGFRSTRLRTLDGHLVTLPNEQLCSTDVRNVSSRPWIKRKWEIGIVYDTPPEKILEAISILRAILGSDPADFAPEPPANVPSNANLYASGKPPQIYLTDLGASALTITVTYWFSPPDMSLYLEHANRVNREVLARFDAAGISFAFPTQTIHLAPASSRE